MNQDNPQAAAIQDHHHETPRETVDSIVVALILAFVFRAFIVEAFVIPTGSMAATLNGAHGTVVCENCGWEFTYGLIDTNNVPQRSSLRRFGDFGVECQNCRFINHDLEITNAKRNFETGDRILVLKWPFDIGGPLLGPQRWHVLVFKDPSDGVTNYIKRLVGMPGEVVEIIEGDVYTVPTSKLSQQARETLAAHRRIKYWRTQHDRMVQSKSRPSGAAQLAYDANIPSIREINAEQLKLSPRRAELLNELNKKLRIQRKSPLAQQSLWTLVYDHDYPPRDISLKQPLWQLVSDENGWTVHRRTLSFSPTKSERAFVKLRAVIDSHIGYNPPDSVPSTQPVSDLRVRFVATMEDGDGVVGVGLRKYDDDFIGEIHKDGSVKILHRDANEAAGWNVLVEAKVSPEVLDRPFEFSMENLDHRVAIHVADQEVAATTREQYAPDVAKIRRRMNDSAFAPSIFAQGAAVTLQHVVVEKDVYYLCDMPAAVSPLQMEAWGTRNHPIELADGEYFFLGDNSAQSKDSRLWDIAGPHLAVRGDKYQLGTVPRDQLIGRAFFVYWPSGLRTRLIPALKDRGWIPNFGQMRWIR